MKSFKTPQTRTSKSKLPAKHYRLGTTAEYVREFNRLNHYSNAGGF